MRLRKVFSIGIILMTPCLLLMFVYVNMGGTRVYFCQIGADSPRQRFSRDIVDSPLLSDKPTGIAKQPQHRDSIMRPLEEVDPSGKQSAVPLVTTQNADVVSDKEVIPHKFRPQWWRNHTQTICRQLGMNTNQSRVPIAQLEKILVDDKHKLLFCQIAKVASTNLGKIFAIIVGLFNGTNPNLIPPPDIHSKYNRLHLHLDALPLDQVLHRINTYFKFVFVRDPFERLLSAYRNKFIKTPSSSFEYLSRKLVRIYRTNSTIKGGVTFEEFVNYLVDPAKRVPTNSHWQPFYELCRPCEMNYDFVGKLATFNEDTRYILEVNNLEKLVEFPRMPDSSHTLHKTDTFLNSYYSKIPKDLLQKLYDVYYPDYALFDFVVPPAIKELLK